MPYIKPEKRKEILNHLLPLLLYIEKAQELSSGDLNYMFTKLGRQYFIRGMNYQAINDVVGALDGAKVEFQRRVVANYEDRKIAENGDAY